MNKFLPLFLLPFIINFNLFASEKNVNLSLGESSLIMLNFSRDKFAEDKLKGFELNLINRNIAGVGQNLLDGKIYFGKKIISDEDMSMDFRIGYGVNIAYYSSDGSTQTGYAPVIGTAIDYGKLHAKFMASFYQDGLAIPYLIGYRAGKLFLGLQGICGLNFGNQISTNLETGLCAGFSW